MTPLDPHAIRRAFGRAAQTYEATAVLQREVEDSLLERLVYLNRAPERVLDVGAGPGRASSLLRKRFPEAQVIALDAAVPMLRVAKRQAGWWRPFQRVAGDAAALPVADNSVDLLFSNLCVQWCADLPAVFDEFRRVLRPGGLLLLSTFGPRTLHELRGAWETADRAPHVNRFVDMPVIGDVLIGAGFRDPVLDLDTYTLTYSDATTLMRELKAIGATNADAQRARGLLGKQRLQRVLAAYEAHRADGLLPATYEVISVQAFGPDAGQPRRSRDGELATFPVDSLRGSRIKR